MLQNDVKDSLKAQTVKRDTLHHDLNVPYVKDEIKRQRYADRIEKHPNILAVMKQVKTTPIKKKTTSRVSDCTVILQSIRR